MKMALNGALTLGTLDGANIEILEAVGRENMFIFGLTAAGVAALRSAGHDPRRCCREDPELQQVFDRIASDFFSPGETGLFGPIVTALLDQGDPYMVLADYRAYVKAQEEVGRVYLDPDEWTRRSILNTARMGRFSSDRAVMEYAGGIWQVQPLAW
jgi:starch phosphorylase